MSQLDNKKSTPPANEKSTSKSPSELKLEGGQKAEVQKPRASALPPEDSRLRHMTLLKPMPEPVRKPTFLEKAKKFLARLFGQ